MIVQFVFTLSYFNPMLVCNTRIEIVSRIDLVGRDIYFRMFQTLCTCDGLGRKRLVIALRVESNMCSPQMGSNVYKRLWVAKPNSQSKHKSVVQSDPAIHIVLHEFSPFMSLPQVTTLQLCMIIYKISPNLVINGVHLCFSSKTSYKTFFFVNSKNWKLL